MYIIFGVLILVISIYICVLKYQGFLIENTKKEILYEVIGVMVPLIVIAAIYAYQFTDQMAYFVFVLNAWILILALIYINIKWFLNTKYTVISVVISFLIVYVLSYSINMILLKTIRFEYCIIFVVFLLVTRKTFQFAKRLIIFVIFSVFLILIVSLNLDINSFAIVEEDNLVSSTCIGYLRSEKKVLGDIEELEIIAQGDRYKETRLSIVTSEGETGEQGEYLMDYFNGNVVYFEVTYSRTINN